MQDEQQQPALTTNRDFGGLNQERPLAGPIADEAEAAKQEDERKRRFNAAIGDCEEEGAHERTKQARILVLMQDVSLSGAERNKAIQRIMRGEVAQAKLEELQRAAQASGLAIHWSALRPPRPVAPWVAT